MKEKTSLNKAVLAQKGQQAIELLRKYSTTTFVVIVALTYGFIFYQITSLNAAEPSTDQVDKYVRASHAPKLDQKLIKQLESLKDNSVNVQALFEQSRENPFQ